MTKIQPSSALNGMCVTPSLIERLRISCAILRTTPMRLADLIPLLQEAADALERKEAGQ